MGVARNGLRRGFLGRRSAADTHLTIILLEFCLKLPKFWASFPPNTLKICLWSFNQWCCCRGGGNRPPPGSILALKKYRFSYVAINAKHEFHETCHSITFLFDKKRLQMVLWHHYARVNSHQRWKQTRFRVCFHLWCELTITMNVTEWQISYNSWKSFLGRKILDFKICAPPLEGFAPPLEIFLATPLGTTVMRWWPGWNFILTWQHLGLNQNS